MEGGREGNESEGREEKCIYNNIEREREERKEGVIRGDVSFGGSSNCFLFFQSCPC